MIFLKSHKDLDVFFFYFLLYTSLLLLPLWILSNECYIQQVYHLNGVAYVEIYIMKGRTEQPTSKHIIYLRNLSELYGGTWHSKNHEQNKFRIRFKGFLYSVQHFIINPHRQPTTIHPQTVGELGLGGGEEKAFLYTKKHMWCVPQHTYVCKFEYMI